MSGPALATIKRLFAVSDNRCAFPGCGAPLVEDSGTVTGEIAHICAASAGGSRYDPNQSEHERHAFANLLLLCRRHHTVVDKEPDNYTVEALLEMKRNHEQRGVAEITPATARAAEGLLEVYRTVVVTGHSNNVAVNSPGAIQGKIINVGVAKRKLTIAPPDGAIGANRRMRSYVEYLIRRYNEFQKGDTAKPGRFKYMALSKAVERQFGASWRLIDASRFYELVDYLQGRIDNTKIGRINRSRGQHCYHSFEEHEGSKRSR